MDDAQARGRGAFARIEQLGGHGVWEADLCVIDLSGTSITDDDLSIFTDFPFVQILSLAGTSITDAGLAHLEELSNLESIDLKGTGVTPEGADRLSLAVPNARITLAPPATDKINPFTGEPFDSE